MSEFDVLIDGYRRFRLGPYREQRERYDQLAQGQSPKVMVIACSDSRVDPTRVFDAAPGQIFVLRNIANLVPPFSAISGQSSVAAAVEYAVAGIKVEHIVVFGHGRCGGIAAALAGDFDNPVAGKHVHAWMEFIAPARDAVKAACALSPDVDAQRALEQANVRLGIENLGSYPFVANAEKAGQLQLHGVIFDIGEGALKILDRATGQFKPVAIDL
ncbi:carbonic anhydrase [Sandaracinobacter sp. RS1-74]|uniref:carbonic anhydrase n=1 Tax=Sandaracinobacteroides sayramensis TaxID=2913411 RepID=UPI001ED9E9F4|nr:carbonic anhydrase [Sandaracinobacteroides sayramensis]MCG2839974.1 carbonic anhydrase [Sandaracinobacteroides sayramensis]